MTITVVYDPTGVAPANLITNEIHSSLTEPDIFPVQGTFYAQGLIVSGVSTLSGETVILQQFIDFVFSPLYADMSAATGKEVYSYILLTNMPAWTSISLTYQAVGGIQDNVLLSQIIAAGVFDRTNIDNWLTFQGDITSLNISGGNYDLTNTGVAYLFSAKLDAIALALRTPSTYISFINTDFANLKTQVAGIQASFSSLNTAVQNSGILNGTFSGSGSSTPSVDIWSIINSNYYAGAGDFLQVDSTANPFTIYLPPSPSINDTVTITDYGNNLGTNNVNVTPNGNLMFGINTTLIMDGNCNNFSLIYSGSSKGWILGS